MTLTEFLADVNNRVPNPYTDANKVIWLNEAISEVYREIAVQDVDEKLTTEDVAIYTLTEGVIFDSIISMTISASAEEVGKTVAQISLTPILPNESLRDYTWMKIMEDTFAIYPAPGESGQVIRTTYQVQPIEYTASTEDLAKDLTVYLRKDYLQAIKYHVLYIICESMEEITKANNFQVRYNAQLLRLKADKYRKQGKYPNTRDVMKPSGRRNIIKYRPNRCRRDRYRY